MKSTSKKIVVDEQQIADLKACVAALQTAVDHFHRDVEALCNNPVIEDETGTLLDPGHEDSTKL
jgi:hypothetical protein